MAQQSQYDGAQKAFSAGRGQNFNMNEQAPGRPMGGGASGMGLGGMKGLDSGGGSPLGHHMKLFASLGLSPSDLDALAEIPDEDISMETLPRILMQLKSRKAAGGDRGASASDGAFRGGRDSWDPSLGRGPSRAQSSGDFGFSSMRDGYGSGYGMGPSSEPMFMQRRMGIPSSGKIQDFLGVMPPMFPHVCSLCDFDVHSTMEWNQHTNGLRHAENRRRLLDMYPDWEPGRRDTPNLSAGLLGPPPMSSGPVGGMSSGWGGRGRSEHLMGPSPPRSRVVVVKYDRKPLSNKTLFAFTETFGRLREHLILTNKAFLEMETHEAALSMVNYYKQHPTKLYGKPVTFYLSQKLMAIEVADAALSDVKNDTNSPQRLLSPQKSRRSADLPAERPLRDVAGHGSKVVFFANLPKDDEKKKELLTIARRFGTVDKHLFLTDQAFVQLGSVEDAEMLVKYYSMNPLIIKGRLIRLNICTKYKTLNVSHRQEDKDAQSRRSSKSDASRTSKSSSKSREEKKKKEDQEDKEKPAGGGEGKEDESGEGGAGGDAEEEEEEPERSESEKEEEEEEEEERHQEEDSGDDDAAEGGAKKEAESEAEAAEEPDGPEDESGEAAESREAAEGDESGDEFDQNFLENMEDFVTLDELEDDEGDASRESGGIDNSRKGGMRVVNILGFRRGYNFLNEMLALAKPFGKVVKHLVLDLRPEAYIQFEKEAEAVAMAKFYNANVTALVCGRPVRITHSLSYPTIQCGSSRVVYVGQIPNVKYSDQDILKLAEPYGKIQKYFLHRLRRECFIEMEKAESAEKMAEACKGKQLKFHGKRLTIYVSRKYKQLKHGHRYPSAPKREKSRTPEKASKNAEEPAAKRQKQESESEEEEEEVVKAEEEEAEQEEHSGDTSEDVKVEKNSAEELPEAPEEMKLSGEEEEMDTSTNQNGQTEAPPPADVKPSVPVLPPYDPDTPVGVEHVKMGYYCRICFLFYSNEDKAKKTHCSTQAHYDKLQKHLEEQQAKAQKKKKKTAV
ncbi:LOW QUALITY PROTEIN: uncharacterized protein V3H82_005713 [Fundulus diaphanus]